MAQADYQRTNGKTTVEKFIAEYEPQYRLNDRTFVFGLGRWERDHMQGFDARWNVSGGLGYKVIDGKAMTLNLKAGPAWRQTDFIDEPDDSEITGLAGGDFGWQLRSEEHTSELPSLMRISYAVFCLKTKTK